jgi:hypothetical protein
MLDALLDLLPRLEAFPGLRRARRLALACAATTACGGRVVPGGDASLVSDASLVDAGDAGDSTTVDAGAETGSLPPCDYDASADYDAELCTPPANDVLTADPPVVSVAAGSYGVATFVATGPWTKDPSLFMRFENSTLPLKDLVFATSYGTPQSLPFLVSDSAAGSQGTLTVSAHAGNIERIAYVTVNITSCVPHPEYCAGMECGYEGDGCGGLQSCGTCAGATPYCYLFQCVANPVPACPPGYGYDIEDNRPMDCIPCAETKSCKTCRGGYCDSLNSVCYCHYPG